MARMGNQGGGAGDSRLGPHDVGDHTRPRGAEAGRSNAVAVAAAGRRKSRRRVRCRGRSVTGEGGCRGGCLRLCARDRGAQAGWRCRGGGDGKGVGAGEVKGGGVRRGVGAGDVKGGGVRRRRR